MKHENQGQISMPDVSRGDLNPRSVTSKVILHLSCVAPIEIVSPKNAMPSGNM